MRDVSRASAGVQQLLFQHHRDQARVLSDRKRGLSAAAALCADCASAGFRRCSGENPAASGCGCAICALYRESCRRADQPLPRRSVLWRKQPLSGAADAVLLCVPRLCPVAAKNRPRLAGAGVPTRRMHCEPAWRAASLWNRPAGLHDEPARKRPRALSLHHRQRGLLRGLPRAGVLHLAGVLPPRENEARAYSLRVDSCDCFVRRAGCGERQRGAWPACRGCVRAAAAVFRSSILAPSTAGLGDLLPLCVCLRAALNRVEVRDVSFLVLCRAAPSCRLADACRGFACTLACALARFAGAP